MPESPRRWPAWVVDAVIGAGVAAVLAVVITADQGGRQRPDAIAYLWAVGLGALMLARRRHPIVVLAVTALGLFAYYAIGYPAIGLAVPVAAALYSAAEFGRLVPSIVTAVVVTVVSVGFRLLEGQAFSLVVGYELVGHVALMAAAIALGDSVRSRRAAQASARLIADLTARQLQQASDARIHAERLAVARDLHDSIGHATSVTSLHTEVARESVGRDDDAIRRALDVIAATTATTMAELRRTVALLRDPAERGRTVISVADVPSLADAARVAGFEVDVSIDAPVLPPLVEAAVFRIAQEAVTNAVRHSGGTRLGIEVTAFDHDVRVRVHDDGAVDRGAGDRGTGDHGAGGGGGGHGIRGMRERAESLGGRLTARADQDGFTVEAVLPLGEAP